MSMIQQAVFNYLNARGIDYKVVAHNAVYTIDEMEKLGMANTDEIVKNLFLRDDKKRYYYLIVLRKDKTVDLKALRTILNSRPLSFASHKSLLTYLGLEKGSVTPFGILNDTNCKVEVVFDEDIASLKRIAIHPNENTATVWLAFEDLVNLIKEHGNKVTFIQI